MKVPIVILVCKVCAEPCKTITEDPNSGGICLGCREAGLGQLPEGAMIQ